jgi:hypothetical protein
MTRPAKICASCGRRFEWRRRWRSSWDEVRHCSTACRRRRLSELDLRLESAILDLLERRAMGATICPSEAAELVSPDGWRALMEPARRAARRLAAKNRVEILQRGERIDPSVFRGPIRVRRLDRRPQPARV